MSYLFAHDNPIGAVFQFQVTVHPDLAEDLDEREAETGSMVRVFKGQSGAINDIAVSPDGKLMASVSWDSSLWAWNLASGEHTQSWQAPQGNFNAVASLRAG
jgi:WD40 repeat protein